MNNQSTKMQYQTLEVENYDQIEKIFEDGVKFYEAVVQNNTSISTPLAPEEQKEIISFVKRLGKNANPNTNFLNIPNNFDDEGNLCFAGIKIGKIKTDGKYYSLMKIKDEIKVKIDSEIIINLKQKAVEIPELPAIEATKVEKVEQVELPKPIAEDQSAVTAKLRQDVNTLSNLVLEMRAQQCQAARAEKPAKDVDVDYLLGLPRKMNELYEMITVLTKFCVQLLFSLSTEEKMQKVFNPAVGGKNIFWSNAGELLDAMYKIIDRPGTISTHAMAKKQMEKHFDDCDKIADDYKKRFEDAPCPTYYKTVTDENGQTVKVEDDAANEAYRKARKKAAEELASSYESLNSI